MSPLLALLRFNPVSAVTQVTSTVYKNPEQPYFRDLTGTGLFNMTVVANVGEKNA